MKIIRVVLREPHLDKLKSLIAPWLGVRDVVFSTEGEGDLYLNGAYYYYFTDGESREMIGEKITEARLSREAACQD